MSRFWTWAGATVGFVLGVLISAAISGKSADWISVLDMAFGAAVALWLFEERSNDQG